ncbi:LysR family transcriptional regulator [Mycobacterium spongiae]|uniref:Probable hydrogen peroxide-inducible genes activator n=1 Tax=Mycobacterium spongiae TaxID=886343 RepID=A0A975JYP7_9MYCO|nr:LysR family transcriptional regulator [Mycobacterium spongiae]QUR68160.1 LysR family transcriptional regulator [Mycobacterium spongiae]
MEIRQLEYFVAVAEEANFTRAAHRVHVAQPAVSAQIRRLESELGQPLLDRSRRKVRLTTAGRAVLPHATAALTAVANIQTAVDDLTQLVRGKVSIGTVTPLEFDIPGLLADFNADHPAVEISYTTNTSDVLIENVQAGLLDVAIAAVGPDEQPAGLETTVVADETIVAAVRHADDLAAASTIALTALADRSLIALPVGTCIRRQLDNACAAAGVSPRIAFEANTSSTLAELAEHGLGVAIMPRSLGQNRAGMQLLTIAPELRVRLVLAWRSSSPISPATRALLDKARTRLVPTTTAGGDERPT